MRYGGRHRRFFTRLRPHAAAGALGLAVLVAASACSGDGEGAIPTPSTTRRSTTTSTATPASTTTTTAAATAPVEQEIVSRYLAFWDARFEANQATPNPDHPGLREYATGPQLDNVVAETTANREQGMAFRRPERSVYKRRVRVVAVEGDTARLQDCVTNDGIVYRMATGEVVDDSVGTRSLEAVMRRVDGRWRLETTRVIQEWEGVAGCALAQDS